MIKNLTDSFGIFVHYRSFTPFKQRGVVGWCDGAGQTSSAGASLLICGWSGGAMVLGKLPVPGRPTI